MKFLNPREVSENLKSLAKVHYKRKETVVKQSSHSSHVIYIKTGLIKVFTERRNDKNIILSIAASGTFIGLTQIYSDVNNFSAIALSESEVCLLPKKSVFYLIQNNNEFANIIYKAQSTYSSLLISKISSLGTKQMHGRNAAMLSCIYAMMNLKIPIFSMLSPVKILQRCPVCRLRVQYGFLPNLKTTA